MRAIPKVITGFAPVQNINTAGDDIDPKINGAGTRELTSLPAKLPSTPTMQKTWITCQSSARPSSS